MTAAIPHVEEFQTPVLVPVASRVHVSDPVVPPVRKCIRPNTLTTTG